MTFTELAAHSSAAQDELSALVASIPDSDFGGPSALPDWSVAHVIGHLIGNCEAQARQLEYAARGELIDVYSGGQEFRDSEIARRAQLSASTLRGELEREHQRYDVAVAALSDEHADRPVTFRNGTVRDVVAGRWMETLVHAVDLGQAHYTWRRWNELFCRLLIDYLLERLPQDPGVRLHASDADFEVQTGSGSAHVRTVSGTLAELAGFLSDRGPSLAPDIELGPYPRGSIPK